MIAALGQAYIHGLQYGPGVAGVTAAMNPKGFKKIGSVAKHLSAYNFEGCIGDEHYPHCTQYRESFNAVVPESDLQETYWRAWRHNAPELSGAMCSYNAVNGVPACGDKRVMMTLMRETWNFTGSIVSDDGAISQIGAGGDPCHNDNITSPPCVHGHYFTNNSLQAVALGLEGGCDVDYAGGGGVHYADGAQAAVDQGFIAEAVLAAAVRRSLSTRMRMGVLDSNAMGPTPHTSSQQPWESPKLNLGVIDCPAHRALAFRAASESMVLLENSADTTLGLPLVTSKAKPTKGGFVAVLGAGSNYTHLMINRYTGTTKNATSFLGMFSCVTNLQHYQCADRCKTSAMQKF